MFPFWCLVTNKTRLWQMYLSVFHQKRDLPLIPWQIMFDRNDLFSLPHRRETSRLIWRKAEFYTNLANFTQETDFSRNLENKLPFRVCFLYFVFCSIFFKSEILLGGKTIFFHFPYESVFFRDKEHPFCSLSNFKQHFTADKLNHHHDQYHHHSHSQRCHCRYYYYS